MFNEKSALNKKWEMNLLDNNIVNIIKNKYQIKESLAKFILNRGYDLSNIEDMFNNKLKNSMPDPFVLYDMDKATKILLEAIDKKLRIAIVGDYDVDGITSTAIMYKFLKNFIDKIKYYIPDRYEDGYGVNIDLLERFIGDIDVLIILDNGTLAVNEISYAKRHGVEVIVVDHHKVGVVLPECDALINPFRFEDNSKLNYLCTAGLVYLVVVAVCKEMKKQKKNYAMPELLQLLDLVAMASVCDMMPAIYLNRCLINQGVVVANKKPSIAIQAMKEVFGVGFVSYETFAFTFGPAINAASRMDYGDLSLKMIISEDLNEAKKIANKLKEINMERQDRENQDIEKIIINMNVRDDSKLIFEGGDYIIKGINGIIASRLKEIYGKPTLIYSVDNKTKIATASGRSIKGLDLGKIILLAVSKNLLIKGGGHGMAVGFSFMLEKKEEIGNFFINEIDNQMQNSKVNDSITFDDKLRLVDIDDGFLKNIVNFAPYGIGFEEPLFVFESVIIKNIKKIGKNNNHVMLEITDGIYKKINAFMYKINNNPVFQFLVDNKNMPISIMANVKSNIYKEKNYPNLVILDAKK